MSVDSACADLARRLAAADDADLPRFAREEAGHLDACRSCRTALAHRDPAALFALLTLEKKDDAFFTGFETRVMAGVREAGRETRGGWLGAMLRPRPLALAVGAAALAIVLIARSGPGAPPPTEGTAPKISTLQPPPPPASIGRPILERDAAAPSPVESVASATARVISIEVAGPQQEPSDLVLIVDPEMPL